ncbi:MAG: hypothetical protein AAF913_07100 [Pseudomonadota bacterium]
MSDLEIDLNSIDENDKPEDLPRDPSIDDRTRQWLSYLLIGLFSTFCILLLALTSLFVWLKLGIEAEANAVDVFLQLNGQVLTAITGVVGTVIGFYFGSKSQER